MKNLKKPARLPSKAPSNQTGGTAWGKNWLQSSAGWCSQRT